MSKTQSAFKQLYTEMFNKEGDFGKVSKDFKKPLKCFVKEAFPHFLVSDGYFFVPCYFTKECISDFKKNFSNVNLVDLGEKVVVLNNWSLEMKKVNSSEVFTSYANLEARLIVNSLKPNLGEKLNPLRYPTNLYRDDEMKTVIQHFRHDCIQKSLEKTSKGDTLPDIAKFGADGKKVKVEAQGVMHIKGDKGDFVDFPFKEGSTNVMKLQELFLSEKGKDALKKLTEPSEGHAKVKGGAKGKKKAAAKKGKAAKKSVESAEVRKSVDKLIKYTPSKSAGKKETPQKVGKVSAKRSVSKKTPAMPSPGGKKSTRTTDLMTMQQFKQYVDWHEKKKKGGKSSSQGKVLGKRSAGKASIASSKSAPKGKKSAK